MAKFWLFIRGSIELSPQVAEVASGLLWNLAPAKPISVHLLRHDWHRVKTHKTALFSWTWVHRTSHSRYMEV
jgi:hypothetical protein